MLQIVRLKKKIFSTYMAKYVPRVRRFVKKAARTVVKAAKRRYTTKTGGIRVAQIVKDVATLKRMVNAEKKHFLQQGGQIPVGQVSGNGDGVYAVDLTPTPSQGTTSITRNGNSIKWHSTHISLQISGQANNVEGVRLTFLIVKIKNDVYTDPMNIVPFMYDYNQFLLLGGSPAIHDMYSARNTQYFKDFQILARKSFYKKADTITGLKGILSGSIGFKPRNHHVKFVQDGSNSVADGQIIMLVFASNGNSSASTNSTVSNIPITGTSTGCNVSYAVQSYFYDN